MRVRPDDRRATRAANGLGGHADILKAPGAVLAIDKDRIGPELYQADRQPRRGVMRCEHGDRLALGEALAQFSSVHGRSFSVRSSACR